MMVEDKCNSSSYGINGFLNGNSSASGSGGGSGSSGLRTYKRRKNGISSSICKSSVVEKHYCNPSTPLENKMVNGLVDIGLQKNSCEQICDQKINCHSLLNGSDDCCYLHWRTVLENMSQSLSLEGGVDGIQGCIRDALNNSCTIDENLAKKSGEHHDGLSHLERTWMPNGSSGAAKGLSSVASDGFSSESGHPTVSRMCERVFLRVLTLEKFAALCNLLMKNFHGLKVEELLDFGLINSHIKGGTYEHTPMLFSSDIQQIWRRLHSIGSEMVSLSKNLLELSRDVCHELGVPTELDTSSDRKHELSAWDSDMRNKWEEPRASIFCTCRQCGKMSDGRDCLVCDCCEEMFHVSCIQPAVKEIPHKNWYCAKCTSCGIGSPHEDCAVCEKLNTNFEMNGGAKSVPTCEDTVKLEESSDGVIETGVQVFKGNRQLPCKVCGCMVNNGEESRVCEHLFCQYKYYHTRCLTNKQLRSYGPRWYCPSCLCRVCVIDKDDDDLVMCDGCDHGYHIYCMEPPCTSIPKGKWFCSKCDAGLQAIQRAKKLYERLEKKRKRSEGKRVTGGSSKKLVRVKEEAVGTSGGMDMLLTAAKTLKEEESTAVGGKS